MSRYKVLNIEKYWDSELMESNDGRKEITIKKLTFGEMSKVQAAIANIKVLANVSSMSPDIEKLKLMMVNFSIFKAPVIKMADNTTLIFDSKDFKYVENLPATLGNYIYEEVEEFNKVDPN